MDNRVDKARNSQFNLQKSYYVLLNEKEIVKIEVGIEAAEKIEEAMQMIATKLGEIGFILVAEELGNGNLDT